MRNASAALIALLNSNRQLATADVLTIVHQDGSITRLTNLDQPVTVVSQYDNGSHTFNPTFPFTRGQTKLVIGTEVDSLELTLSPNPSTDLIYNLPWPAAARLGLLDGVEVLLEKVVMSDFIDTTPGTLILFWGRVGTPTISHSTLALEVQSYLVLLQSQLPRNVYQPGCLHTLFDSGCGLNRATYQHTGTIQAGSTRLVLKTDMDQADGFFDLGVLKFTSGALNGQSFPVDSYELPTANDGIFTLVVDLPSLPGIGTSFECYPGCDKTQATCTTKFSNLARFRGYPVVPAPESAR
jgi:uncharacterized phage protein (TIGR02218 family)